MAAQATLLLVFIISGLVMDLPWTYAGGFSVFKSTPDLVYPYHYGQLLDTVPMMSILECARLCSRSSKCSGYDYHDKNRTCQTKGFVRNKPPTEELVDLESTSYVEIVCDEPPDIAGAQKDMEGFFVDPITSYTCRSNYAPCLNKTTSACQSTRKWEDVTGLCRKSKWDDSEVNIFNNHRYYLPCGPENTFTVNILATPTQNTKFAVNIWSGKDLHFHSSFRKKIIVFNTKINGRWGREEENAFQFIVGKQLDILIMSETGVYVLEINGAFIHKFNSHVTDQKPEYINIVGDVSVSLLDITV